MARELGSYGYHMFCDYIITFCTKFKFFKFFLLKLILCLSRNVSIRGSRDLGFDFGGGEKIGSTNKRAKEKSSYRIGRKISHGVIFVSNRQQEPIETRTRLRHRLDRERIGQLAIGSFGSS